MREILSRSHEFLRCDRSQQTKDLAWNRIDEFIPASDAFKLYERNWRLLDPSTLEDRERALIERLKNELGNGEINA